VPHSPGRAILLLGPLDILAVQAKANPQSPVTKAPSSNRVTSAPPDLDTQAKSLIYGASSSGRVHSLSPSRVRYQVPDCVDRHEGGATHTPDKDNRPFDNVATQAKRKRSEVGLSDSKRQHSRKHIPQADKRHRAPEPVDTSSVR
jgi:hypothetical protein